MMTLERSRIEWSGLVLSVVMVVGVAGVALGNLAAERNRGAQLERASASPRTAPTLAERIGAVDRALARKDMSAAVYAWGDAYSLALGARRWDAMVEVGDAAVRIDALADSPPGYLIGFRAEARQAYLRALFLARHARSEDGIERVARAFAALGDTDMAARVHTITVTR